MKMQRLRAQSAAAAVLLASFIRIASAQDSPESPVLNAPPPPSAGEREQIIQTTRELALQYTANLPNFVCTQTVRRFELEKRKQSWKVLDTLIADMTFSQKGESKKLLTINGKPTKKTTDKLDGMLFNGVFGSFLRPIFNPKSETKFNWERWTNLRGRPTHVFSYRVERDHAGYHLSFDNKFRSYRGDFAFGGLIYVDRETRQVMRFTHAVDGIPDNWPVTAIPGELDYGFVDIDGKQFLLPLRAEERFVWQNGDQQRNVTEFSNYHKFSSETTISLEK